MVKVFKKDEMPIDTLWPGVRRQILGHDTHLMLVKVFFEKGAEAPMHQHPHQQVSLCLSGRFEVVVEKEKSEIREGDSFMVPSFVNHGVNCLEPGVLLDAFSPRREDFLK